MGDVAIIQWIDSHGILLLISWMIVTTLVGYLPSPTKDDSRRYVYFFMVSNSLVFQFARAFGAKLENSPNFRDGIIKAINGGKFTQEFVRNPNFQGGKDDSQINNVPTDSKH
jgi:hypothetical protein